jgi:hypothetical protein
MIVLIAPMLWATGVGAEVICPMAVPVLGGPMVADELIDDFLPVLDFAVQTRRWRQAHRAIVASGHTPTAAPSQPVLADGHSGNGSSTSVPRVSRAPLWRLESRNPALRRATVELDLGSCTLRSSSPVSTVVAKGHTTSASGEGLTKWTSRSGDGNR